MLNQYNLIARLYSPLSRLVFGNRIEQVQAELIKELPASGSLVILGGGNGFILPLIYKQAPNLTIEFVEASSKMIELAKQKVMPDQDVVFTHSDDFNFQGRNHNLIYAAFFLDLFKQEEIRSIIERVESKLAADSPTWFVADFHLSDKTKRFQLRSMIIKVTIFFFKLFTKHGVDYLPDVFLPFDERKYKCLNSKSLAGNFTKYQVLVNSSY